MIGKVRVTRHAHERYQERLCCEASRSDVAEAVGRAKVIHKGISMPFRYLRKDGDVYAWDGVLLYVLSVVEDGLYDLKTVVWKQADKYADKTRRRLVSNRHRDEALHARRMQRISRRGARSIGELNEWEAVCAQQ